jgi:8-oxo-dGTP diphosphatase
MMQQVYVVRHAKAGSRDRWDGDDVDRPLTKNGRAQADALAVRLRELATPTLLSSPYARCIQTLEPLADLLDTKVTSDDRLTEGAPFEPALELVLATPHGSVLCSHGDLIPDLVGALHRRGAHLTTDADWRKATVWVLSREHGRIASMAAWSPPQI